MRVVCTVGGLSSSSVTGIVASSMRSEMVDEDMWVVDSIGVFGSVRIIVM